MSPEPDIVARRAGLSLLFVGLTMAVGVRSLSAASSLHIGAGRPTIVLPDSWDRLLDLSSLGNQPVLLLYEDQKSSHQNDALKEELAQSWRVEEATAGGFRSFLLPTSQTSIFGPHEAWSRARSRRSRRSFRQTSTAIGTAVSGPPSEHVGASAPSPSIVATALSCSRTKARCPRRSATSSSQLLRKALTS